MSLERLDRPSGSWQFFFSVGDESLAPYRQCSTGGVRPAKDFGASIVDTAICAKPGEVLAEQLLYGDSIHRTHFALT